MYSSKPKPRHRRACRPQTPFTPLTGTFNPVRSLAVVSATGVALFVPTGAVATEVTSLDLNPSKEILVNHVVEANPVFAAPGDMEWAAADTVAVAVVTPEDVAKEEQEKADKEAAEREAAERAEREAVANRSYERQEPASVAVPTAHFSGILGVASQYLGTPYVFGGTSPAGFDCSGYVQYVYAQAGVQLPRTAAAQAMVGTQIPASQAQPGDLVYFPSGHIGIYAGNGQIMHAPYPGRSVELVPLWNEYYQFVRL